MIDIQFLSNGIQNLELWNAAWIAEPLKVNGVDMPFGGDGLMYHMWGNTPALSISDDYSILMTMILEIYYYYYYYYYYQQQQHQMNNNNLFWLVIIIIVIIIIIIIIIFKIDIKNVNYNY
jgi:hypothetical protein